MIERVEPGRIMSRAVVHNGLIYFSGHVDGGKHPTIREQAAAIFKRYDELLLQYGSDRDHILSAVIYITDMGLKQEFNEEWAKWIREGCAPCRVCVEVGLGDGYLVEITLVAERIQSD